MQEHEDQGAPAVSSRRVSPNRLLPLPSSVRLSTSSCSWSPTHTHTQHTCTRTRTHTHAHIHTCKHTCTQHTHMHTAHAHTHTHAHPGPVLGACEAGSFISALPGCRDLRWHLLRRPLPQPFCVTALHGHSCCTRQKRLQLEPQVPARQNDSAQPGEHCHGNRPLN